MPAAIASIQIGSIRTEGDAEATDAMNRRWTTAFYKFPVSGPVAIYRLGVAGDEIADMKNHGGVDKAVLGYSASHYPLWRAELGRADLEHGAFAENLTIRGQDESSVCIGDLYEVGRNESTALLEISQPRQPCWKISRRWQHKTLTKLVAQTGRTGWYFRVLREGWVNEGDPVTLLDRRHPDWTIARANDLLFSRDVDRYAVAELMALELLAASWKDSLG